MGRIKAKTKTSRKSSGLGGKLAGAAVNALSGSKGGGGRRRKRGPAYWSNKVLVEKLKKKYNRIKYGGAR